MRPFLFLSPAALRESKALLLQHTQSFPELSLFFLDRPTHKNFNTTIHILLFTIFFFLCEMPGPVLCIHSSDEYSVNTQYTFEAVGTDLVRPLMELMFSHWGG